MTTQLIHYVEGTPIVWTDSGASGGTAICTLATPLATVTGRMGAQVNLGAGARPRWYYYRGIYRMDTTAVVGEAAEWYLAYGDGTYVDGNLSTSDGALTSVALPNLTFLGAGIVQVTTADTNIIVSGRVWITSQYVSGGVYNRTTKSFKATSGVNRLILSSDAAQIQAAV